MLFTRILRDVGVNVGGSTSFDDPSELTRRPLSRWVLTTNFLSD